MKTLGILGGMGPYASLRFCDLLLQMSIDRYGAKKNADFPHFLLSNLPVPDLITDRLGEEKTITMVEEEAKRLEAAGAEVMVLACNTMHLFQDRFKCAVSIPFISLVDIVVQTVKKSGRKKVGLLGSMTTLHSDLYAAPLRRAGIELVVPLVAEHPELTRCIQEAVAHRADEKERSSLRELMQSLQFQGAQAVILGCTELPLIARQEEYEIPIYDSLRILADAACEAVYQKIPIQS